MFVRLKTYKGDLSKR